MCLSWHKQIFAELPNGIKKSSHRSVTITLNVSHILQIQLYLLLHNHMDIVILRILSLLHQFVLVAKLDACRVSNSRTNIQHMHLFWCPIVHIFVWIISIFRNLYVWKMSIFNVLFVWIILFRYLYR